MIKYENLPIAEKVKKQKALIKLLNIGIDKETKKKRDNFMMDARKNMLMMYLKMNKLYM